MDIMKKLRKAKKEIAISEAQQKEEEELSNKFTAPDEPKSQSYETDPELLERISSIENKTPKLELSIASLKRENEEIKNKLTQMDSKLIEMLSLYEVVANQVNPFVGISKVTSSNIEKLEKMEKQIESMGDQIDFVEDDIKVILHNKININDVINNVLEVDGYEQFS